jgi:serine/threonine protein kinase
MPLSDFLFTDGPHAEGGFAIVRFATHAPSGRPVAVKQLRQEKLNNEEALHRFQDECRTLEAISYSDPGYFVEVIEYDLMPPPGTAPWLAMERCARSLSDAREAYHDPLVLAEAMAHVCAGLALLHDKYLTSHRDLKPQNLLVGRDGKFRIGDFGSHLREGADYRATGPLGAYPTTDEYQAPECWRKGQLPEAIFYPADVYAIGVTMYELLTGRLPIDPAQAGSHWTLAAGSWREPALIRTRRPEVTRELQDVVHQCLELHPELRPTAADLAGLLRGAAKNGRDGKHSQRVFTPSYPNTVGQPPYFVLPIHVLAGGDGTTSYHADGTGRRDILVKSTDQMLELPEEVVNATDDYLLWKEQDAASVPYRFEDLYQVRFDGFGFTKERPSDGVLTPLTLQTSLTNYYATHRTNFSIDTRLPDGKSIRRTYGGHRDDLGRTDLTGSSLANPICVNLSVVTLRDNYLVFAQRGSRTGGNPGGFAPAVSGTADLERDRQVEAYDPWEHGKREGSEEVWGKFPVAREDIVYYGLAMRTDNFCPFLFGEARLDTTVDALKVYRQTAKSRDEIAQLIFVRFTIEHVMWAIRDLWSLKRLSPTAIFSLYASLIYRFDKEQATINEEFRDLKRRGKLVLRDALQTSRYE